MDTSSFLMKACFQYHPETTSQTVTTKEDNTEDKNVIVGEGAREPNLFAPTMPPKWLAGS